MKHIKKFEGYFSKDEEVNEGLFTSLTTDIKNFLEKTPTDVKKADQILINAFARTFNAKATQYLRDRVLNSPMEVKQDILRQCLEVKKDPKVGILKLKEIADGKFKVGGAYIEGNIVSGK